MQNFKKQKRQFMCRSICKKKINLPCTITISNKESKSMKMELDTGSNYSNISKDLLLRTFPKLY